MKRKLLGILAVLMMVCGIGLVSSPTAWAIDPDVRDGETGPTSTSSTRTSKDDGASMSTGTCSTGFLGFKPWYDGYCENGEIKEIKGDQQLTTFVWIVILNISYDISLAAGFIAIAMVIYSGYMYIMSQGDPGKMASGKKSLMSAIIGVIITMGATVIVNTIKVILGINGAGWNQGEMTLTQVQNAFSWAYGMAGLVATIFIVKNGVDYMLSQGDPSKTQKATRGLIFAVVGLAVVIFAAVITSFVTKAVSGAM